jgi:serine phosphatase RsbU (regulator of sigma subunit)
VAVDLRQHVSLLKKVPLFRSLPEKELASFLETLGLVEFNAGDTVFEEGQAGEHFYVVVKGSLEIIKYRGKPEEELLAQRGIGEFIGEMSLLDQDGTRMASVIAREDVQLIEISRAQFNQLLARHPLTAYEMVRVMSNRLTNAHEKSIRDLTQKNLELTEALDALKRAQDQLVEKERLERELELAADIQHSLLPQQLPTFAGYDFYATLQAARFIGGDLYDFIPIDDENLGLIIGDVTDKGVPAALLMAQAQTLIRSETESQHMPAQLLKRTNAYLLENNDGDHFITLLYGILHLPTAEFRYARAGHEAPWLFAADGSATEAPHGTGQPLGILEDPSIDEQMVNIPAGGFLLLHTDGLVDNLGGREQSGHLLEKPLGSLSNSTAREVCEGFMRQILAQRADEPLLDDVTLIAVGRTA